MKLNPFTAGLAGNALATLTGILLTLAFAPYHFYPLAIFLPTVMYGLWQFLSAKQAFWRGWWFGIGFFGFGIYWIFISIHTYGNASIYLSALFTGGLIAILAIFTGLTGFLLNRYFQYSTDTRLFCAFPAIWVFLEWVRSWIFTGFPWLLLGNSQIYSPLRGYAIFGVYFVSWVVLLSASILFKIFSQARQKQFRSCFLALFILIVIWIIGAGLNLVQWTHPQGAPIKVSLVQGNIPQEMKWSPDTIQSTLETYRKLSEPHWDSKLIIWPEAAITVPMQRVQDYLDQMNDIAKNHDANLITGIPVETVTGNSYYNAVIMLGKNKGYYIKERLVPFGEYVPFSGALQKLLDVLNIPMSNFVPPTNFNTPPMQIDDIKISTFICYEIAFPQLVRTPDENISLLLTVSDDAWFGRSIAQAQHLEIAQMRALEMGRPVLFVSNNGLTAIINAKGNIQSIAPPFQEYVLTDTVQPMRGKTPWQRVGMDPILLILIFSILIAIRQNRKMKSKLLSQ